MQKLVSDYLDVVCGGIRRKALRQAARNELSAHLNERCQELENDGWEPEAAAREAVARMGDPAGLGARISEANRMRINPASIWIGGIMFAASILFPLFFGGGTLSNIYDIYGILGVVVTASAYGLLVCGGKPTLASFLRGTKTGCIYAGVLCAVIGIIVMLRNLSDIAALGAGLAVALLSVFYGVLFSAITRIAESYIEPPEAGSIRGILE